MSIHNHHYKFGLTDEEYFIAWCYARHYHVGGRDPVIAFLLEKAFSWMTRYPIKEDEKTELVKQFMQEHPNAKAVRLSALPGKNA